MASQEASVVKSEANILTFEFSNLLKVTFKTGKSLYRNLKNNRARMYLREEIDKLQDDHGWKVKIFDDFKPELRILKAAYKYNKLGTLRGLLKVELTREGNESLLKHFGCKEIFGRSPIEYFRNSLSRTGNSLIKPWPYPIAPTLIPGHINASRTPNSDMRVLRTVVPWLMNCQPSQSFLWNSASCSFVWYRENIGTAPYFCDPSKSSKLLTLSVSQELARQCVENCSTSGLRNAETFAFEPQIMGSKVIVRVYKPLVGILGEHSKSGIRLWMSKRRIHDVVKSQSLDIHLIVCPLQRNSAVGVDVIDVLEPAISAAISSQFQDLIRTSCNDANRIDMALVTDDVDGRSWTISYLFRFVDEIDLCEIVWNVPLGLKEYFYDKIIPKEHCKQRVVFKEDGLFYKDLSKEVLYRALEMHGEHLNPPIFFEDQFTFYDNLEKERDRVLGALDTLVQATYELAGCLVAQLESGFEGLFEAMEDIQAQRTLHGLEERVNQRFDIGSVFDYVKLGDRRTILLKDEVLEMIDLGRKSLEGRLDLFDDDDILSDAVIEAYITASRKGKCEYRREDEKSIDREWVNEAYGYGFCVPCRSKTSTIVVDASDNFYIGIPSCKMAVAIYKSSMLEQRVTSRDVQLAESVSSSRARKALLELCAVLRPDPSGKILYSEHARQQLLAAANNGLVFSLGRVVEALRDQVYRNRIVWQQETVNFQVILEEAYRVAKLESDEEKAWLGRELASVYARLGMFEEDSPYCGLIQTVSIDFCNGVGNVKLTEPLRGDGIKIKLQGTAESPSGKIMLAEKGQWMGTPMYRVCGKRGWTTTSNATLRRCYIGDGT